MGPATGLEDPQQLVNILVKSGVNAIIGHKGILKLVPKSLVSTPFIFHLSGATNLGKDPEYKTLVSNVETAVAMGADAVSIHVTFGHPQEREMLNDFLAARWLQERIRGMRKVPIERRLEFLDRGDLFEVLERVKALTL